MTTTVADNHHDEVPKGITRWLFTTNHKDIGTLYLWFSFIMFLVGGSMALVIRAELFQPGLQVVDPLFYNQMVTVHALIMIFGAVMPGFVGFANWMIPMMIGAPDGAAENEQLEFLAAAFRNLFADSVAVCTRQARQQDGPSIHRYLCRVGWA